MLTTNEIKEYAMAILNGEDCDAVIRLVNRHRTSSPNFDYNCKMPWNEKKKEMNREERIDALSSLDDNIRNVSNLQKFLDGVLFNMRRNAVEIASKFDTTYDEKRLLECAKWFWKNVDRHPNYIDCECTEDGIGYAEEVIARAIGGQPITIVKFCGFAKRENGLEIFFRIPDILGAWQLSLPFSGDWKPSYDDWNGDWSFKPMQMCISYASPALMPLFKAKAVGWSFEEIAENWKKVDLEEIRQYYIPKVVDGYVMRSVKLADGSEVLKRTELTEEEYWKSLNNINEEMVL